MRPFLQSHVEPGTRRRNPAQAGIRMLLVAALCLVIGLGLGALWHSRRAQRSVGHAEGEPIGQEVETLSAATAAVLQSLPGPVQIQFYAVLDKTTVPEAVPAFAGRVEQLLAAYRRESGGKISVIRHCSPSDAAAAAAEGMKPFNLEKGDACYLGLTVTQAGRKESIPRLFPEWEQALESDLSRAIARVFGQTPSASTAAAVGPVDPATLAEVKRQIPNFATISLAEGTRILRESAFNDFKAAMREMESQLKEAQQRLARAQEANAEIDKQAAMRELQGLQAEQAAKLRDISVRSSAQVEALRQLRESSR